MRKLMCFFAMALLLSASQFACAQQDTIKERPLQMVKFNFSKILCNELAFSYEFKYKNKAAEIELCYVYPTMNAENPITMEAMFFVSHPALYYKGVSLNVFYKWYRPSYFYYGVAAIYKYSYFDNKWEYCGGDYQGEYSLKCSQYRNSFGLAFRCGFLRNVKNVIFDPYLSLGIRLMNSNTIYHYYEIHDNGNNYTHVGQPGGVSIFKDNGLFLFPYVNLGCKIGIGWPRTAMNRKTKKSR